MKSADLPPVSQQFLYSNMFDEAAKEYQELVKKHYGIELSEKEAHAQAMKFLTMFKIISKPVAKELTRPYKENN